MIAEYFQEKTQIVIHSGNFSLIAPSRPLLSAPIQICMNPLFTLHFNEILLGATFTGQVGAVKAQFPSSN